MKLDGTKRWWKRYFASIDLWVYGDVLTAGEIIDQGTSGRWEPSEIVSEVNMVRDYAANGIIYGKAWSVATMPGYDMGTTDAATVTEITQEEFEAAKARGFTAPDATLEIPVVKDV